MVQKWTDERTEQLKDLVGSETPVSRQTVASAAIKLDVSERSIASKLRKEGFDVESAASATAASAYSEEDTAELKDFVTNNSGNYTYSEIAAHVLGGARSAKSIQGKILSLELTSHVKATPKAESVKTYTDAEEATVVRMINDGAFIEDIAEAVGKAVNSIRGKALSLQHTGVIEKMPAQRTVKGPKEDIFDSVDLANSTVADLVEKTGKTEKGVKTTLTRRGLTCKDYDGAAKAAKAAKKVEKVA